MSIIITRGIKCLLHARVTAREETAIELRLQSSDARPKIPVARGMWIYKDQVCLFAEGLGSDSTPVRHHPRDAVHCLVEGESPLLPSLLLDREAIESAGSCSRLLTNRKAWPVDLAREQTLKPSVNNLWDFRRPTAIGRPANL